MKEKNSNINIVSEGLHEETFEGIYLSDLKGNFIEANSRALEMVGYDADEISSLSYASLLDEEQLLKAQSAHKEIMETGSQKYSSEYRMRRKDGSFIWVETRGYLIHKNGKPHSIKAIARDISDRKKIEEDLRSSEELFRTIVESAPSMLHIIDENGNNVYISPNCIDYTGYTREELNENFSWWVHSDDLPKIRKAFRQTFAEKVCFKNIEFKGVKKDGSVWYGSSSWEIIRGDNNLFKGIVIQTIDISEAITAQKALIEKEEQFRLIAETSIDAIFIVDNQGIVKYCSPSSKAIIGYRPDEIIGRGFNLFMSQDETERAKQAFQLLLSGKNIKNSEFRSLNKNGEKVHIEICAVPIMQNGALWEIIGIARDISDRKEIEQTIHAINDQLMTTLLALPDLSFEVDDEGRFHNYHAPDRSLLYMEPNLFLGKTVTEIMPEDIAEIIMSSLQEASKSGRHYGTQYRLKTPAGEKWFELSIAAKERSAGPGKRFIVLARDITQQKLNEERIQVSLKEKEILLKEIHHRVKNNMQVISSLLHLQSSQIKDDHDRQLFTDSQSRVFSMALVHEKLYNSENISEINFSDFINDLIKELISSYYVDTEKIKFTFDMDRIFIGVDNAIPCSLIINELLSNAMKYAFPDGREGKIEIIFKNDKEGYRLVVSDNGVGIPDAIDYKKSESLGLQLVNALTRQLDGSIELDRSQGTRFTIRFTV